MKSCMNWNISACRLIVWKMAKFINEPLVDNPNSLEKAGKRLELRQWPIELAPALKCPVLGLYGGKDAGNPQADIDKMRQVLADTRKTNSQIIVYPDAQHGFLADYRPSYNAKDSADAWAKMLAHFKKYGVAPAKTAAKA